MPEFDLEYIWKCFKLGDPIWNMSIFLKEIQFVSTPYKIKEMKNLSDVENGNSVTILTRVSINKQQYILNFRV